MIGKMKSFQVGEDVYSVETQNIRDDGGCDTENKKISIRERLLDTPLTNQLVTFFHEVNHAVAEHFKLTDLLRCEDDERVLENIVECAARGQVMTMLDNIEFFEWVVQELKKIKKEAMWPTKRKPRRKK